MTNHASQHASQHLSLQTPVRDNDGEATSGAPSSTLVDDAGVSYTIEVVTGQPHQGTGFSFKVVETGALFRCQVMRYPAQPRFWCLTVYLCLTGSSPDVDHPRWLSNDRLTREAVTDALAAVRANPAGWLADPSRDDIRKWVLSQAGKAPLLSGSRSRKAAVVAEELPTPI
jgi:hypothetical protein